MATRRKTADKGLMSYEPEEKLTSYEPEEDVIVLKKSWVINAAVAVLFFILGGASGIGLTMLIRPAASPQTAVIQQQAQPTQAPTKIDNVEVGVLPARGPEDAPVTIVEFSDFQCPYCKQFRDNTLDQLVEKYGDKIKIYYRNFPLTAIHPEAQQSAMAAMCANEQGKFWQYHDALFATQAELSVDHSNDLAKELGLDTKQFASCVESEKYADQIDADIQDASSYGVSGTPTFFINGWRVIGAVPLATLSQYIDTELNQ